MSKGDQTRQLVLDEATRMVSRLGVRAVTIGGLAERVEMSKSGLYAHFRSKEALQLAALDHGAERFVRQVIAPALRAPRGEARVRDLFDRWMDWDRNAFPGGCPFIAVSFEVDDEPGPVHDWLVRNQRDWIECIATVFRTGIDEGQFRADADPDQFAQDVSGVMLAFTYMSRLLGDELAEQRARAALDVLLDSARRSG